MIIHLHMWKCLKYWNMMFRLHSVDNLRTFLFLEHECHFCSEYNFSDCLYTIWCWKLMSLVNKNDMSHTFYFIFCRGDEIADLVKQVNSLKVALDVWTLIINFMCRRTESTQHLYWKCKKCCHIGLCDVLWWTWKLQ